MEEIRYHPWTLAELSEEDKVSWLAETSVNHENAAPLNITEEDLGKAVTSKLSVFWNVTLGADKKRLQNAGKFYQTF
jgi:hypothetical protein